MLRITDPPSHTSQAPPSSTFIVFPASHPRLMGADITRRIVQACRKMKWHNYAIVGKVSGPAFAAALIAPGAFECLKLLSLPAATQPHCPSLHAMLRP